MNDTPTTLAPLWSDDNIEADARRASSSPTYKQLPLDFDAKELTQRVQLASAVDTVLMLPPGLRDFAREANLRDEQVRQLAQAWDTIRGHRPTTVAEWREFYGVVKRYVREVEQ